MGAIIKCCLGCKPPKRNPYCHSTCPEYLEQKAEYDERKAIADKERMVGSGVQSQKSTAIHKALKGRKVK